MSIILFILSRYRGMTNVQKLVGGIIMIKKKLGVLLTFIVTISIMVGCVDETGQHVSEKTDAVEEAKEKGYSQETEDYSISFTTGVETGTLYPLGAIMSEFWSKELPNIQATSGASNGSTQNLNFLSEKEAEVGLTMGNVLVEAYDGEGDFNGKPYKDLRVLAGLHPNYDYVIVRKGSGIETIEDLKGHDFVPGATGSGTEKVSNMILDAHGLSFDDVNASFVGFGEATELMRNKQIDGTIISSGIPASAVTEALTTADGKLISIDDEKRDKLVEENSFYVKSVIPKGTYDGQDEDIQTTSLQNILVADASMPDDVAYDLVKSFWENQEEMEGSHGVFESIDIENVDMGIGEVPFHPGAEKYYQEQDLLE